MQRILILILTLSLYIGVNAAVSTSITLSTAGTLKSQLTTLGKLTTTTDLTVSGPIDAQDFKTMKSSMSALLTIDISNANIIAFSGTGGTDILHTSATYLANEVPVYALSYNTKITSIVLPTSATRIADHAFYYCSALTQVTIASSITDIDAYAFNNCTSLLTLNIPASVTLIGTLAVSNCNGYITVDAGNTVYSSLNGILYNKAQSELIQCPTSVSGSISLPSTTTTIDDYAFNYCTNLTQITIPASVSSIGNYVFKGCPAIIIVDAGNTSYSSSDGILYNADKTTLIQCPTSKSGIINIPSSVNTIGAQAFYDCTLITQVTIPNSVTTINASAFNNCTSLTTATLPTTLLTLGNNAFYNCTNLTQANIPSSVTVISGSVFYNCTSLTQVTIPVSVTTIGAQAFYNCPAPFTVDASNNYFSSANGVLFNKSITTLIQCPTSKSGTYSIPGTVTTISNDAFNNCLSITQVDIASGMLSIGNNAFYNCKAMTQVNLPASITSIGTNAFYNCTALSSIYAYWATPITLSSANVFGNVNKSTCTLYVPTGTTAAYEAAPYWTAFTNIVEFNATPVETSDKTQFSIYPNPASSYFTVTTDQPAELVIIALSGVEVHKQFVYDNDRVDISHLKQGIYLVNLNNQCLKLVKRY